MTPIVFFSVLSIPIHAATATFMYRRKQNKIYPVFWAYIVFQASRVAVESIAYVTSFAAYFYSYWISSACSIVLSLLLLRNIFLTVLEGYSPLNRLRRSGYEIALLASWTLALFVTYNNHHYTGSIFPQLLFDGHQAASFVAVGMFLFVVGSSALLGIRWTSPIYGIALGLGLLGTVDLAVFAALSHNHLISSTTAGWIETITYDCAAAIFAFFFVPKREEATLPGSINPEWVQWLQGIKGTLSEWRI